MTFNKAFMRYGSSDTAYRLFCFPYAGSSSNIYRSWSIYLNPEIEVISIQLPGRGSRINEIPFKSLDLLIEYLAKMISPLLHEKPFFFLGHSMGALIAFELSRYLHKYGKPNPEFLILSGRQPPNVINNGGIKSNLPDKQFIESIKKLNGIPNSVLENSELMEIILPSLRADFEICESYNFSNYNKLNCPFLILNGNKDIFTKDIDLRQWSNFTTQSCIISTFKGDHFFIFKNEEKIICFLKERILSNFNSEYFINYDM